MTHIHQLDKEIQAKKNHTFDDSIRYCNNAFKLSKQTSCTVSRTCINVNFVLNSNIYKPCLVILVKRMEQVKKKIHAHLNKNEQQATQFAEIGRASRESESGKHELRPHDELLKP